MPQRIKARAALQTTYLTIDKSPGPLAGAFFNAYGRRTQSMPRQANGTYLAPANTSAVTSTPISSTAFNTLETDIGTEITNSLDRGGRSAMTAALPMGANKITGMAEPTVATDAATKNYVDTTTATFFSTGDVKLTFKTVADSGWLLFDDGTFGSVSSGSSNSNSANNLALFTLFFNAPFLDANLPILTSGGGATTRAAQVSAAAAWAANCRMTLPRTLGRALAISGTGAGLPNHVLGVYTGSESVTLAGVNIPTLSSSNASQSITVDVPGSGANRLAYSNNGDLSGFSAPATGSFVSIYSPGSNWLFTNTLSRTQAISTTFTNGSPTAVSIMQPTTYMNAMVKQ